MNISIHKDYDYTFELVNSSSEPYFLFLSGQDIYAIDAKNVHEIIEYQDVTKIPLVSPTLWGVTNVRGNIIPVMDFNARVLNKVTQIGGKTSFVLVSFIKDEEEHKVALVIDEIYEVDGLDENSAVETPSFGTKIDPKYIQNISKYNNKEIYVLNIAKLIDIEELGKIVIEPKTSNSKEYYFLLNKGLKFGILMMKMKKMMI